MKKSLVALALLVAITLLPDCSKKHDAVVSKSDMLTRAGGWGMTSFKLNDTEVIQNCTKDDNFKFLKSGTFTFSPGTLKCDPTDETVSGDWEFKSSETILHLEGDSMDEEWTILTLTTNSMKLQTMDSGDTFVFTFIGK